MSERERMDGGPSAEMIVAMIYILGLFLIAVSLEHRISAVEDQLRAQTEHASGESH